MAKLRPDPKFGWHAYWIAPMLLVGHYVGIVLHQYRKWKQRRNLQNIKAKNPDIQELSTLAGITKSTKHKE